MAKKKRVTVREHTGNDLHIEFERWTHGNYYIPVSIVLRQMTEISVYGHNPTFEWEGMYNGQRIHVKLPRQTSERSAVITGDFPNELNTDRGNTYDQLYNEMRRVLRQLD